PHHPPARRRRGGGGELAPVLVRPVRRRGDAQDRSPPGGHERAVAGGGAAVSGRPDSLLAGIRSPADLKRLPQSELGRVAEELRSEIVRVCSIAGGHLASSLGAVELTVALHYLYDSAVDRIVWDVGHQTYGHKILTGRADRIETIRQPGGLAGFTATSESEHDALTVGHASTSLAAALGMALARDARKAPYEVVAVIGDGALTGGMALAALNQIGHVKPRMTIVLNDNEMSISENVGAINHYMRTLQVQCGSRPPRTAPRPRSPRCGSRSPTSPAARRRRRAASSTRPATTRSTPWASATWGPSTATTSTSCFTTSTTSGSSTGPRCCTSSPARAKIG